MTRANLTNRSENIALARLWLADGAPIADVLTMLEVRYRFELSPSLAHAYAVEILWAVQHSEDALNNHPVPTTKEIHYAAA